MTTADRSAGRVEEAGSLAGWTDLIRERFVPLHIRPHGALDVRGSVRSRHIGHLQASTVASVPMTFDRSGRQAAAAETGLLAVGLIETGRGYLEQDGRNCVVSDGGFAVYDTTRPFRWSLDGPWTMQVFTWPRAEIVVPDRELQRLTARTVLPSSAVGDLLSPMLRRLCGDTGPALSGATAGRLADEVAELALIAASECVRDGLVAGPEADDEDVVRQVMEFVEDNLSDPLLGPDLIAREFFMSTRTLHRVFARRDLTIGNWIKARRLDACRRALCSPSWRNTPISEVASRHGIVNASFFSREFAARFGMTPRHCRRRAQE